MEDMIDDFITFFVAGQETTANTLAFCFIEIAKNPLVAKKLREEIDSVLGDRNEITNEDLAKLNYVSSVIKETLRLWSPAESPAREINVCIWTSGFVKNLARPTLHTGLKSILAGSWIGPYRLQLFHINWNISY